MPNAGREGAVAAGLNPSTPGYSSTSDWLTNFILTAKTITATAELLPFPYLAAAFGPLVPVLQAVQQVGKNREDFRDLCASIIELVTMLKEEISHNGETGARRLQQLCGNLESVQEGLERLHRNQRKGIRHRLKEFTKSSSLRAEIEGYRYRLHDLRTNFTSDSHEYPAHSSYEHDLNVSKLSSLVQLNVEGFAFGSNSQSTGLPIPTGCPPPSRIFHGRRTILDKMHQYFSQDIGRRHICLLHGLGGSGKTQIAFKFLDETDPSRFTEVFLIDASTVETITGALKSIAISYSIGSRHEDTSHWLATGNKEWLLVFDNADDPSLDLYQFFPQSNGGNILITSRNPQLCVHAPGAHYQVSDMEEEDAVQLLLTSAGQEVKNETAILATQIVKHEISLTLFPEILHCLPLAVVQAGAFISKMGDLKRYLGLYEQNRSRLLSELPAQSHDRYACFQRLSSLAAQFLQICSFLHHEGISEVIFSNAVSYTPRLLGPTDEELAGAWEFLSHFLTITGDWDSLSFLNMVAEIRGYSLINHDPQMNVFSIHPLVHDWSRNTIINVTAVRECTAAIVAMSIYGGGQVFRVGLLPHLNFVMQGVPQLAQKFLMPYGWVYHDSGQFHSAEELQLGVLEKGKQVLGSEHPDTLQAMSDLAVTYRRLGKLQEAEEFEVIVLEQRKEILGQEHSQTLQAMANLAATYGDLGKYTHAEELQVVVLKMRRQHMGYEHPETLQAMAELAVTSRNRGGLQEAQELDLVVLEKRQKTLGAEHPDTLQAMANLATTFRLLGKFQSAKELVVPVLENRKQVLGMEHPDTLSAMESLATIHRNLGKFDDAEKLSRVVLEKRRNSLGIEHPQTLDAMSNLAAIHRNFGSFLEAEQLELEVLERRERILGPQHPDTIQAMSNLAITFRGLKKFQVAKELNEVVLRKMEEILGVNHPLTFTAMESLAATHWNLGNFIESEVLDMAVLEKRQKLLGPTHPDTLQAMANVAATYRAVQKYKDAEKLDIDVFRKREEILGMDHPDTLTAMANLAATYWNLGKFGEAEKLDVLVLEKRTLVLGTEHPHTMQAMANLAATYGHLERAADAEELDVILLEKTEQVLGSEHPRTLDAMANLAATMKI
ncbi:hypothetical protein C8J57DRAFT_1225958 [Mycena rebaudengoi]|nr:hypothetical protein C8J57DRAFT_1225958 [Mycena rebaudengoi]